MKQAMDMNGHGGAEVVYLNDNSASAVLVRMCDPDKKLESDSEFREVWVAIKEAIEGV
jgi:3-methyladenine DNA glycosylase Mpg